MFNATRALRKFIDCLKRCYINKHQEYGKVNRKRLRKACQIYGIPKTVYIDRPNFQ